MNEVPAGLLAVGDDVEAGALLFEQRDADRTVLASRNSSPARRQSGHRRSGWASQPGLGKLPAIVVGKSMARPSGRRPCRPGE
ncbi:MAG: hypothetical protein ACLPYS_20165 [Vulcanimicrobiaceae bacterium]